MAGNSDRRRFLKTAAGVAAAVAVGREASAQTGPRAVAPRRVAPAKRALKPIDGVLFRAPDEKLFYIPVKDLAQYEVTGAHRRALESRLQPSLSKEAAMVSSRDLTQSGLKLSTARDVLFVNQAGGTSILFCYTMSVQRNSLEK